MVQQGGESVLHCSWSLHQQLDFGVPLLRAHVGAASQAAVQSFHNGEPPRKLGLHINNLRRTDVPSAKSLGLDLAMLYK